MSNLLTVDLTSGVPTTGTGTVMTLNSIAALLPAALAANGGLKIEGVSGGVVVPISDGSGSLTVDNGGAFAVQATQSGTWNVGTVTAVTSITNAVSLAARTGSFTASFTPAASSHSANTVIGAATALTLAGAAPAGEILINSISLQIATGTIPSGQTGFSLKLYNVTPPSALGDTTAWDLPSGDRASYLGAIDFTAPTDIGSTLQVDIEGLGKQITLATSGVLYGQLVTVGAITPAAVAHKATLHFAY